LLDATSLPDISKWDTGNVTSIFGMFDECISLEYLPDISKWDTKNVTNMKIMFFGCTLLKSLPDILKWDQKMSLIWNLCLKDVKN